MKFYKCKACESILILDAADCCGAELEELIPNTTDAAGEKHVPQISVNGDDVKIQIGSVEHPSLPAHYIEFILLQTNLGIHTRWLKPGMVPTAAFRLSDGEKVVAAFEYCNLHGLWSVTL